jgi:ribosomal protein L44E
MDSYCKPCGRNTEHKQHFQEAKNRYPNTFWGGVKKYVWETLVIGGSTNMALKKLDELDLVLTCESCGAKKIENQGGEFQ